MKKAAKPKQVQVYDPKVKRWVKVDRLTGKIVGRKGTRGAYPDIPKRKTMPKRRKTEYELPKKITSMRHGPKQSTIGDRAAKTPATRAGRGQKSTGGVTPTNQEDREL